jgi:hypothetical protein
MKLSLPPKLVEKISDFALATDAVCTELKN